MSKQTSGRFSSFVRAPSCVVFLILLPGWACAAESYPLQPEDMLQITVWGHPELSFESSKNPIAIRPDGAFSFPIVGEIRAEGKTIEQITDELIEGLKVELKNPKVSVNLLRQRPNQVYVLGEVSKPGAYSIGNEPLDIKQAIALSGGLTRMASLRGATLFRPGELPQPIDLRAQLAAAPTEPIYLQHNDTIIIREKNLVSVVGMVNRPGTYQLEDGARLADALAAAGGLVIAPDEGKLGAADQDGAFIISQDGTVSPVSIRSVLHDASSEANVPISSGDTVVVPEARNQVAVLGEVRAEGSYGVTPSDRLSGVIALAGGPTDEADLCIIKLIHPTGQIDTVNLEPVIKYGEPGQDMLVNPGDTVVVPERKNRVAVFGLVNRPGVYKIEDGDTILDILGRAGGYIPRRSDPERVILARQVGDEVEAERVNIRRLLSGKEAATDYLVTNGDLIFVPRSKSAIRLSDVTGFVASLGGLFWIFNY